MSATDMSFYDDSPYERSPYEPSPYEGSVISDYTHRSGLTISASSTPLSPVMSPRQTSRMSMRSGSRGRASPSPSRSGMTVRTAPYSAAERNTNKRWSTGSQTSSPYTNEMNPYQLPSNFNSHSHHSSPTCSTGFPPPPQQMLLSHGHGHGHGHNHSHGFSSRSSSSNNGYVQSPYVDDHGCPTMPNHLVKMLQSNAAEHYRSHYADQSDPPDLYASLAEDQIPPPPEDMNPSDPELMPHEQDLRFEGDLYTPKWVRGHGNKREGWCGICKPGRWLVLKNSAFWYDKSFTHGISAATGQRFVEPKSVRRMEGNPDVWEGLCHSCSEWVALVSNKKKGTTWFRHAYKVSSFGYIAIIVVIVTYVLTSDIPTVPHASQDQGRSQAEERKQSGEGGCSRGSEGEAGRGSSTTSPVRSPPPPLLESALRINDHSLRLGLYSQPAAECFAPVSEGRRLWPIGT